MNTKRIWKCRWLCVLLACLAMVACGCRSSETGNEPDNNEKTVAPVISQARLQKLIMAVEDESGLVRRRAIQELTPLVNSNPLVLKSLLERALNADAINYLQGDLTIVALGSAKGDAAKKIVGAYRESGEEKREILRPILGRMGTEAREARPLLRTELNAPGTNPKQRAGMRVVLASIGAANKEEMAQIAKDIESKAESCMAVIEMMTMIGRNEWVDERIKAVLVKWLLEPHPLPAFVLWTMGKKADKEVKDALAKVFPDFLKPEARRSPAFLAIGLSLAVLDTDRREATLRTLFKIHAPPGLIANNIIDWICGNITDKLFIKTVTSLLEDRGPVIAAEAAELLGAIGWPAREARPKLIQIIKSSKNEELRDEAATAMQRIGKPREPGGKLPLPMPPGAVVTYRDPDSDGEHVITRLRAPGSVKGIADFFKRAHAKAGWKRIATSKDNVLTFTRGYTRRAIVIEQEATESQVEITVGDHLD